MTSTNNSRPKALHFGAGSLGRGLVVPVLVASGLEVAVVDTNLSLVTALAREASYPLEIAAETEQLSQEMVPVSAAFHPVEHRADLGRWLEQAAIITTSVRFDNLPKVAGLLRETLRPRLETDSLPRVIACENVERASSHLAQLVGLAARQANTAAVEAAFLDAVVDRNSQAAWPERLTVRTEAYWEWAVGVPAGTHLPLQIGQVENIDRYFQRKRYLVNTVADSLAFLGLLRGHQYLHQAARDGWIGAFLGPMFEELQTVLADLYGFERPDLDRYQQQAIRRLQTSGVKRRIDTVARDPWRKLALNERYARPAGELIALGSRPVGLARAIAVILWLSQGQPGETGLEPAVILPQVEKLWQGAAWSDQLQQLVLEEVTQFARSQEGSNR